eukprot:2067210-Rhodomonas_salina.1
MDMTKCLKNQQLEERVCQVPFPARARPAQGSTQVTRGDGWPVTRGLDNGCAMADAGVCAVVAGGEPACAVVCHLLLAPQRHPRREGSVPQARRLHRLPVCASRSRDMRTGPLGSCAGVPSVDAGRGGGLMAMAVEMMPGIVMQLGRILTDVADR